MSIDFNGTTSKLEHTTASVLPTGSYTIAVKSFADAVGETDGFIITFPEGASDRAFSHDTVANRLFLFQNFNVTDANFNLPALDGQWNSVAISYDPSSVLNVPVARVNYLPVTVTTAIVPVGTAVNPATTGYCVGNISGQTRTFNGMLRDLQVANVIWTPAEMDQACMRPGSVRRGLKLWLRMLNKDDLVDLSGNGFNGTGTALTNRVGGPSYGSLYTDGQVTLMAEGFSRKLLYMGVG